jgi:hypothetical protein
MRLVPAGILGFSAAALAATSVMAGTAFSVSGAPDVSSDGPPMRAVASLDCPASQGGLTRTDRAADGRSCDYRSADGETVHLSLVPLQGRSAVQALEPMKAQLHALMPIYNRRPAAMPDKGEAGDRADIDLPFFHIHTVGNHADVRMFGVKVHSEGENADVNVSHGHKHTVVHAGADGAEVVAEDVGRTNAALVYVLASDKHPTSGFWSVGYVAKGPVKGPLVVGEFRTTRKHSGHDGDHNDIGRLIDRNVKG